MDGIKIEPSSKPRARPGQSEAGKQVVRVPKWRPGQWVVLKNGKIKHIYGIGCTILEGDEPPVPWRAWDKAGSSFPTKDILREATEQEIQKVLSYQ